MFKNVNISGVEVELRSSALTVYLYKNIFNQDLMKGLTSISKKLAQSVSTIEGVEENADDLELINVIPDEALDSSVDMTDLVTKLAYVMSVQATTKDYGKHNINTFYEWLEQFDATAFQDDKLQGEIIDCYSSKNEAELKKNNDQ